MTVETVATNTTDQAANTTQAATNAAQTTQAATNTTQVAATPSSFDKYIADQPDAIKELFDTHIDGLKSALDSERTGRKDLEKQLRNLSKQATEGSDLKTQLDQLAENVKQSDSRAAFYEGAHEAGVRNLKLAWVAAKEYDVLDTKGNVDFGKLKTFVPELFTQPVKTVVATANAGNGANQAGVAKPDMNTFLRTATGRR